MSPLLERPFAHRGLHGGAVIENSRAAFAAAIAAGQGIELDVRLSRDHHPLVIHDEELDRLTDGTGAVAQRVVAELQKVKLRGCDETVPTLAEVLQLVGGQVPLLIEIKAPGREVRPLCLSVFRTLHGYRGAVGIMSFNPEVSRWFAAHAPRLVRGLVVTEDGKRGLRARLERQLALLRARPEFIAYDIRDLPSRFARKVRRSGIPLLTWTVRSAEEREIAAAHADQIIYERVP